MITDGRDIGVEEDLFAEPVVDRHLAAPGTTLGQDAADAVQIVDRLHELFKLAIEHFACSPLGDALGGWVPGDDATAAVQDHDDVVRVVEQHPALSDRRLGWLLAGV